jgi:hypothetical protein
MPEKGLGHGTLAESGFLRGRPRGPVLSQTHRHVGPTDVEQAGLELNSTSHPGQVSGHDDGDGV